MSMSMRNKTISVIGAVLLMLATSPSLAGGSRLGVVKCGDWVQERNNRSVAATAYEFWLLGYLSGISVVTGKKFLNGTNAASIELWMDNYCRNNPLESIGVGGDALSLELIKRM
jgi:hypothetical protein